MDADGSITLNFAQAQEKAATWFRGVLQAQGGTTTSLTVREAVQQYLEDYTARGGKALAATRFTIDAHVLPSLGERQVSALTSAAIRRCHRNLAESPARLRSSSHGRRRERTVEIDDAEGRRARRATANRVLTVLKAALNHAFREGRVPSDDSWRRVQPFAKVDAPRVRYLTDAEATRLVNACPADLHVLVTVALLTGCRYGELTMLRPIDVDLAAGVLTIPTSKGGSARHVVLTGEARQFLGHATGKSVSKPFLLRGDGALWGRSHQFRPLREACNNAGINPVVSFHVLRRTHASRLAMKSVPMARILITWGIIAACTAFITGPLSFYTVRFLRKRRRRSSARSRSRSAIACWISPAQRTASTTLANSASTPSPVVLTIRP